MSYYAELRDGGYRVCFEFQTQELRDKWIALQNIKISDENEKIRLVNQKLQRDYEELLERLSDNKELCNILSRISTAPGVTEKSELFVPLTKDEALEIYPYENNLGETVIRVRHKIYDLNDLW